MPVVIESVLALVLLGLGLGFGVGFGMHVGEKVFPSKDNR